MKHVIKAIKNKVYVLDFVIHPLGLVLDPPLCWECKVALLSNYVLEILFDLRCCFSANVSRVDVHTNGLVEKFFIYLIVSIILSNSTRYC